MEAESIEYERGLTFEKVWATIQKLAKAADRRSEETDRKFQETGDSATINAPDTVKTW